MPLLALLIFLTIFLFMSGLFLLFASNKTQRRLQAFSPPGEKREWSATVVSLVGPFARLSTPTGSWDGSALRIRFLNAGIRSAGARPVYFGAKTLLPLALGGMGWLALEGGGAAGLSLWGGTATMALLGCYLPDLLIGWKRRRRMREIFENFPD